MVNKKIRLILVIVFFIGVFILLYPLVSQYWNSLVQSRAIYDYDEMLVKKESIDYEDVFMQASRYNQELFELDYPLIQYKNISSYNDLLNVGNNGMMGYITIDKIGVEIPIYHGTSASVLNEAVGHLTGSSLPVGGDSTHSVLSAHSGMPSSKLFTNLNRLEVGDIFEITVINRKLTYSVDKIVIVQPNDVSDLEIVEGYDYVTLITCTPYGLNTHRLLVRGIRVSDVIEKELVVTADAYLIDRLVVSLVISIFILIFLFIYVMMRPVKRKNYKEEEI